MGYLTLYQLLSNAFTLLTAFSLTLARVMWLLQADGVSTNCSKHLHKLYDAMPNKYE